MISVCDTSVLVQVLLFLASLVRSPCDSLSYIHMQSLYTRHFSELYLLLYICVRTIYIGLFLNVRCYWISVFFKKQWWTLCCRRVKCSSLCPSEIFYLIVDLTILSLLPMTFCIHRYHIQLEVMYWTYLQLVIISWNYMLLSTRVPSLLIDFSNWILHWDIYLIAPFSHNKPFFSRPKYVNKLVDINQYKKRTGVTS